MTKQYYIAYIHSDKKKYRKPITGEVLTANNREYGYIKVNGEYNITDLKTGLKITKFDEYIKSKQAAINYIKQFDITVIDDKMLLKMENDFNNYPILEE
jgi:hypothetical protein